MENLNLLRAKFAIENINVYNSNKSFINSIPALIHNNGLLATLQFDKQKNDSVFCSVLCKWLAIYKEKSKLLSNIDINDNTLLISSIASITNVYDYQLLTDEVMNLLIWLKRSL